MKGVFLLFLYKDAANSNPWERGPDMKRMAMFVLLVAALVVAAAPPASSVMTNQGIDRELVASPNDLTPGVRGNGRILYAPSEADDPGYRAMIAAITGGTVDYFDARVGTPDAALLNTYDCVNVWANYAFANNVLYGDNLADFVDGGGSVVLGVWCLPTAGNYLAGRIMTTAYCPVTGYSNHYTYSNYIGDGTTCIHTGVVSYACNYRDVLTVVAGGTADGHYADGEIAHAYRADYKVIYSNGSGASALGGSYADWPRLIANACGCSCGGSPVESETWGTIKSIFQK